MRTARLHALCSLLALLAQCCRASTCPSSVYSALSVDTLETEYLPLASYGLQPPLPSVGEHYVRLASPLDACTPLGSNAGAILLAYRGNCTFWEKALIAAESGAKGLVVINNSTFPPTECLYLATDTNRTDSELAPLAGMFVASATGEQGSSLVNLTMSESVDPLASFSLLKLPKLDPAALLLLSLAVLTIGIAAAWTGMEFKEMLAQQEQPQQDGIAQQESPDNSVPTTFDRGDEQQIITIPVILTFVGFTSIMMFVLFFVLNKWIFYVFVGLFAYGAAVASGVCMHTLVATFKPAWLRPTLSTKWVTHKIRVSDIIIGVVAITAAVVWVIFRRASWAFVLQNMLGMCFMAFVLQTITLPSLRVASVFLVALFCYDVFMVFITPLFMPGGDSVMVRVATGGDMHEVLPMLLVVPRLMPGPPSRGMMLGYGDVVVPGLLIMLLRRFDVAMSRGIGVLSYTFWAIVAYVVGILLTDAALVYNIGGSKGQPALLYLVPCTLGTAGVLAWVRGDLPALWRGEILDVKDHISGDASHHGREQAVEGGAAISSAAVANRMSPDQEHVAMPDSLSWYPYQ